MNNDEYNLICSDFQQKIIEDFNIAQLPFIIKYFLFQQIWNVIQKQKIDNDLKIESLKSQKIRKISLDEKKEEKIQEQ